MLGPKEVMMLLEDEAIAEFDEKHDRPPTAEEEVIIATNAFNGIGNYYAELGDLIRSQEKEITT
jgi:hypothetical protein